MQVSIVVPAFNESRRLPATLDHIGRAARVFASRGWDTQLLVCDNNSTDDTAAVAREHGAGVVFEPVNQISRARNAGAAAATGDWLVFIDADSHPSPALFEAVAACMADGRTVAGGSTLQFDCDGALAHWSALSWNALSRTMRWAAGSFIFVEASAFRRVGGFSTQLYAAEELDLFRRLKRLARDTTRRIVIVNGAPLVTSGRKLQLYRWHEIVWFFVSTVVTAGRTLRSAKGAFAWYDGRR